APQAPGSLRRLVPKALVVAFLAGGTTAFVAHAPSATVGCSWNAPRRLSCEVFTPFTPLPKIRPLPPRRARGR
ncbi:hypothetical protein, partial [Streptomyces sp. NPDC045714]|uniref:hypothetical protein n=1 Tax=Streptomyces sp. NPDC045714 TaxID=3154913 RepID=UPI003405896A